jgi:hypothetical protein
MKLFKSMFLCLTLLVLVAVAHHQFITITGRVGSSALIAVARAGETPTPTPSPSPTPTPTINQSCTLGFFKNHPQFISGCFGISSSTTVKTLLGPSSLVDSCVGDLTLLQALQAPASQCGTGNLAQAELIMIKQLIAAVANAGNSNPAACGAASTLISQANLLIAGGDKASITAFGSLLESTINNDKIGTLCGGS